MVTENLQQGTEGPSPVLQARSGVVLVITAGAAFMAFLDVTIVNIAFPSIHRSFASTPLTDLSWILNAYNIVFAALLVPAGRVADLIGRRRTLVAGLVLFGTGSLLCGLAPSAWVLVATRALQAIGAAAVVPTSLALLLPAFPLERRGMATSLWGASGAVSAATGPTLGALLIDAAGWRWVFFVNVPIAAVLAVAATRVLPDMRDPARGRLPDAAGVLLLAGGVGALALALVKTPDWGWTGARTIAAAATATAALTLFAARSADHPAPVVELSLFRLRSFAVSSAGSFVFAAGFYAYMLNNVLFLSGVWHYSVLRVGAALTPGPVAAAAAGAAAGRAADRWGERAVTVPGAALFAIGAAVLAAGIGAKAAYVSEFLPGTLLTGVGVGMCFAGLTSGTVADLPPGRYATGSALGACFRQIGSVLGLAALIAAVAHVTPTDALATFHHNWWAMTAVATLCVAVTAALPGASRRGAAAAMTTPVPYPAAATTDEPGPATAAEHAPSGAATR